MAKVLSKDQITLFSQGLSFALVFHFDLYRTILDVNGFAKNIIVHRHFLADTSNEDTT